MHVERAALSVAAWLFTYALHSTVILAAAWLAAIGLARLACTRPRLRDALPALRERLWKLALLGGLATASVQVAAGLDPWGSSVALAPEVAAISAESIDAAPRRAEARPETNASTPAGVVTPTPATLTGFTPSTLLPILAAKVLETLTAEPLRKAATERVPAVVVQPSTRAAKISTVDLRPWIVGAVGVWALVASFGVLRSWAQWRALRASLCDREPIVAGSTRELFDVLCARAGVLGGVHLSRARSLPAPITFGIRRREICIPPRAESELQRDELAALLGHEIAHAKRRDPMWLAIARAVEVLFFFQPLNRRASIWMQDEAEYLCDDAAIVWSGERVALASCLTEIAGWIVHGPRARLASAMAAPGTRLTSRVRRLLDDEHEPRADERGGWVSLTGAGASACVAFLVPGVAVDLERGPDAALGARVERLEAVGDSWSSPATTSARPAWISADSTSSDVVANGASNGTASNASSAGESSRGTASGASDPTAESWLFRTSAGGAVNSAPLGAAARDLASTTAPNPRPFAALTPAADAGSSANEPSLASELAALQAELAELDALAHEKRVCDATLERIASIGQSLRRLHAESAALEALLDATPAATAFPLDLQETP